jgi:hypothetical protein
MRFKNEKDKELIFQVNPLLLSALFGVVIPTIQREVPGHDLTITRTIDEKIPGVSVSDTHKYGRAIDIRTKDLPRTAVKLIEKELNLLLGEVMGAISLKDGQKRFCVLEDFNGENEHFHIQIRELSPNKISYLISCGILYSKNKEVI